MGIVSMIRCIRSLCTIVFIAAVALVPFESRAEKTTALSQAVELPLVAQHPTEKFTQKRSSHKSRKARRSKTTRVPKKTMSDMNYDELKVAKNKAVASGNKEVALKYMEKMIPICNDLSERAALMLEVADARFENGLHVEAGTMYQEFTVMYPGHEKSTYAEFKSIECSYATILIAERDQTATKNTLELAQAFLTKYKPGKEYYDKVATIVTTCNERLFESELSIIKFYLHQKNKLSVEKRLKKLRESMLSVLPACEQTLIETECLFAELTQDTELLVQKQAELATKFPINNVKVLAGNAPRVDYMTKF